MQRMHCFDPNFMWERIAVTSYIRKKRSMIYDRLAGMVG